MNLKDICDKTADVAIKAGDFIAREAQKFEREQTEIKSLNSLVSYVDKEAEAMIVELLSEIVPEAGFIAEAALQLNDIFSTAQAAADDYLTSIKAANVSMEEEQKAAEKEQMLNGADE